jgi:hypothetical protein
VRHPQDSEASGIHRVAYDNVNNTWAPRFMKKIQTS